ncbi:MAG: outer membrane beta-barrel protein, partial [Rhizobiales bacterium]|nr:outer membrane beta-barrel protein [Hyphomicrobiales bacterium]
LRPGLAIESDWSRHRLSASVSGEAVRYLRENELSTYGADAQANLRLDVRHGTRLELETGYALTSTGSASSEVPDTAVGNRLSHLFRAGAAIEHDAGFAGVRFGTGVRRELFEDVELSGGGTEDNGDRDYTELGVSLRGTFNRGAVFQPFAEVSFTPRFHDRTSDRNGLKRDSRGYSGTLGLRIDDDPLWSGEIGLTYLVRDYEDNSLDTERAPGLLANLQWRPTELTKVDLSATMDIAETASAADGGRATWSASTKVTHALQDNIDLIFGADVSTARAASGRENTYGAEAGVEWKLNPMISWSLLYDGTWQDSPGNGSDYNEQRLLAGIILKR